MATFGLAQIIVHVLWIQLNVAQVLIDAPAPRLYYSLDATQCQSPRIVDVRLEADGVRLSLELTESTREFLPPDFQLDPGVKNMPSRPCFYQGVVLGAEGGLAAAKIVDGMFSATFSYSGKVHQVYNQPAWQSLMSAYSLPPEPARKCGLSKATKHPGLAASSAAAAQSKPQSSRLLLKADTSSLVSPANRKFLQMILVADLGFYIGMNRSVPAANSRLLDIANFVNGLYKQLGINVITVKTIVMTTDELDLKNASAGVNASELLDKLLVYRMQALNNTQHSVVQLVSGYPMTGGLLGLANLGKLCHFAQSAGVNWDNRMNDSAYSVATTVAHEMGHNLGMFHDDEAVGITCPCPDLQGCIMASAGGSKDPLRFSDCSMNTYQEFSVPNGLGYCMTRPPLSNITLAATSNCGNRIVEPGEDCDCGLPSYCNNTCCNPTTCKLNTGASCASGLCCNTTTCSLVAKGNVCRAARGSCDLPEFCNGTSEWCPEFDDYLIDGSVCATNPANSADVMAYCYGGDCSSRDARCAELFTGAAKSAPASAAVASTRGNETGYCQYKALPATSVNISYEFIGCTIENQRCGTLYCSADSPTTSPTSNWKSLDNDDIRILAANAYTMLDLTPTGFRDPAMVPNGAECGANKMCVNSACLPVSSVTPPASTLPNCNNKGKLTASRLCYCEPGFAPPDCVNAGSGGSINNQPMPSAVTTAPTTTIATTAVTTAASTSTTVLAVSSSPQLDSMAWVGIGIGIGVAAACLCALVIALIVWACRRNARSADMSGETGGRKGVSTVSGSGAQTNMAYQYSNDRLARGGGFDNAGRLEAGPPIQQIDLSGRRF